MSIQDFFYKLLAIATVFFVALAIVSGVSKMLYKKDPCVSWSDNAAKSVGITDDRPSYVLKLFEAGKIEGIPNGWTSLSRGCCKDRLDYLIFEYPKKHGFLSGKKRDFNEVHVSAQWITCEEYDGKNTYVWPPEIVIQKDCYKCDERNGWYHVEKTMAVVT